IAPGAQVSLDVTYTPTQTGHDLAPLYIESPISTLPFLVSLDGDASVEPTQTDTFKQAQVTKVDFLFVIDNSGSMADKQENIASNASQFLQQALSRNV